MITRRLPRRAVIGLIAGAASIGVAAAGCSSSGDDLGSLTEEADPSGDGGTATTPGSDGGSTHDGLDGAGDDPSGDGGPDAGPPPVPYQHFDVNHVLSTGQSNAVANDGKPVLTTSQPYDNLMFDVGIIPATNCDGDGCTTYQKPTKLVPLIEGDVFFGSIETMSAGLANETAKLAKEKYLANGPNKTHPMLVSLHGRSGNSYACLRKGGCAWWPGRGYVKPFDDAMMEVRDGLALSLAAGKSYAVRAVTVIHGEHDHYAYSSNDSAFPMTGTDGKSTIADYGEGLIEWQRDYDEGVKAITKQTVTVPLLVSQYSHWNDVATTKIAYQQMAAHKKAAGKVVVIGPTYVLPYSSDCLHFTNHGQRHLGEYFAKAYARIVLEGKPWEPLRPLSVTLAGNVVTVKYLVPKAPLVLDTTRVSNPGNYGFEFVDGSGAPPKITSVAVASADTVAITLATAPTGANKRLRYAYTFTGCGGSGTIARGNVRDSDDTPSQYGYDLSNWSVHFDEPVN